MLNSKKTMKRYWEVILNAFLTEKFFDDDKKSYFYDRFFVSGQKFSTEHFKIDNKLQVFPGFFFKTFPIPGFLKFFLPKLAIFRFFYVFLGFQVK